MDKNADQVYIEKVLKGDTNSFAYLINKYKDMTYTLAMKIVKNHEDAEEVAQDSFLKAYEKLDSFKGDSKFSTWLYTIVYRNSITKIRKKKVATSDIDDYVVDNYSEGSESPQIDAIKGEERKKYVKEAIDRLPEKDAYLVTLFYMNDSSIEEIEKITGLTQSNIKVKLFRARKKLNTELSFLLKEEVKTIL
ncbi:sigma-70 family RNA polymerase sigma factor [Lutimonas saemankumensis]|uniref:RNA polymerase sigma factor n=1 Tax=Lutimonas saemankumensis TaxID=483016 RepID=UPI001CD5070D|nr:sigma-70 family RNA polymerase sigma factor [Lutimonas saemankumensis]MCA0930853.1 sigma-70 family RNA polymerase sigma factor [Lutimonas saemankumensis]